MSIDKVNLDLLGRVEELEILTSALLGERDAKGDLANLQTVYDDLVVKHDKLKSDMGDVRANLSHVRAMLNSETKSSEVMYTQLTEALRQRDSYRQELMDLHDYIMSGGDHECDMGPDCPVMECLRLNP